jgi:lysophospholipase L1-like esterase
MSRTRWFDTAAVALAVAIVVGLVFALRSDDTATIAADPSTVQIERPQPAEATRPSVLYIGDSYTLGNGSAEMSYACMVAVRMGWYCHLSALPGTGFISGGPANRFVIDRYLGTSTSFIERIPHLAAVYQPDVLFLDGGRNDLLAPVEDVFLAMRATINEATQVWPTATIIVIRPRFLKRPSDDLGFDDAFFERLQPTAPKVVVLDPLKKLAHTDTSAMVGKDEIHPNRQGELAIASALTESLSSHRIGVPA